MSVNLFDIRQHGGSQQNAWEELAYQLRPPVGSDHVETRKTRAPDAGVEWYEVYADGHVEGFQAKFHARLEDALGGMRESVTSACAKRPTLTRLTFVLPYDFTDTGEGKRKSDQDRWTDAVASWKKSIHGAANVEFGTILAGDVLGELALERHAGRRAFWFGALELPDEWFEQRLDDARLLAGERYTPEADTDVAVNMTLEASAAGNRFLNELKTRTSTALAASRRDSGIWGSAKADALGALATLESAYTARFRRVQQAHGLPIADFDIQGSRKAVDVLLACTLTGSAELPSYTSHHLRTAQDALYDLSALLASDSARAYANRALAVVGPAGSGKTHALLRVAERLHAEGSPVVLLHGQRFADADWWSSIRGMLDLGDHRAGDFLQALDSLAEARARRAVIFIDALNESKDPWRWASELVPLLAQAAKHPHVAVVVSFRNDYRSLIGPPSDLTSTFHAGFRGEWLEAVSAYCQMFGIDTPSTSAFDPAFASPLFLRMWCEVVRDHGTAAVGSRSAVFEQFAATRVKRVATHLRLAPTNQVVREALDLILDQSVSSSGRPLLRGDIEPAVDALLPNREWPNTLFAVMHSEGLIELYPYRTESERVALPFQALSEHLIATRLLAGVGDGELPAVVDRVPWLWRTLAVMLPEQRGVELLDIANRELAPERLMDAMRDSLLDRHQSAFSGRALSVLKSFLTDSTWERRFEAADLLIGIGPRLGHPANADWLHAWLLELPMAERDAVWSVASYTADETSTSFERLCRWAACTTSITPEEELVLAGTTFMWLLTSPNRFLRDKVTRSLTDLLSRRLSVGGSLIERAQLVDDTYVQERVLLACYGALMIGGENDTTGAAALCAALRSWPRETTPVHVLARDSARGIAHWAESRGFYDAGQRVRFDPPFDSVAPSDPPTAGELEAAHGVIRSGDEYGPWRASSILQSCLTWMGDFHKYVMESDVQSFSRFPLTGPKPQGGHREPLGRTDPEWAGRWIADRAIELGWTSERFAEFEGEYAGGRGRESHKSERFGKKYQWQALHELLARLADNYHVAADVARTYGSQYQGPWIWYGRDLDPCLPLPPAGTPQHLAMTRDDTARWATLATPDLDGPAAPGDWVARESDLTPANSVFHPVDDNGQQWVALHRYASWDRNNAARSGTYQRERDIFHLQFSWLVPAGDGGKLLDLFRTHTLSGRWMDDQHLMHGRYIGELGWAPVTKFPIQEEPHYHQRLKDAGLEPVPAVEKYLWEGSVLDCSLSASVDFYVPTDLLLDGARWHGSRAEWLVGDAVVARSIEVNEGECDQSVLVADSAWLRERLAKVGCDLVVGVLGERHALPPDDDLEDEFDGLVSSNFWYGMVLATSEENDQQVGPIVTAATESTEADDENDLPAAALGIFIPLDELRSDDPGNNGSAR